MANVSEVRPQFSVRGLPPDTHLTLVLYTATSHARSKPLTLHASTRPRYPIHFTGGDDTVYITVFHDVVNIILLLV